MLPGSGGQLNHLSVAVTAELIETVLGCGGCIFKVGFEYFGAQFGLGLSNWAFGLDLGQWVSLAIVVGPCGCSNQLGLGPISDFSSLLLDFP